MTAAELRRDLQCPLDPGFRLVKSRCSVFNKVAAIEQCVGIERALAHDQIQQLPSPIHLSQRIGNPSSCKVCELSTSKRFGLSHVRLGCSPVPVIYCS